MLNVSFFNEDGSTEDYTVNYVSFFSDKSFGPPALVAPKDGNKPIAKPGETVLYYNTSTGERLTIERTEDD